MLNENGGLVFPQFWIKTISTCLTTTLPSVTSVGVPFLTFGRLNVLWRIFRWSVITSNQKAKLQSRGADYGQDAKRKFSVLFCLDPCWRNKPVATSNNFTCWCCKCTCRGSFKNIHQYDFCHPSILHRLWRILSRILQRIERHFKLNFIVFSDIFVQLPQIDALVWREPGESLYPFVEAENEWLLNQLCTEHMSQSEYSY